MKRKKLLFAGIAGATLVGFVAVQVFAQTITSAPTHSIQDFRQDIRQDRQNLRQDIKTTIASNRHKRSHIMGVQVTGVSGSSLTVTYNGKPVTVNTDSNTKFRRRFWGTSSISEISVGDTVNIWGSWADDTQTTMTATMIRDLSIMKRFGVFFGTVQSLSSNGFVVSTVNRGNQTVTTSSSTKFINRRQGILSFGAIKVGDKVRVRGMWDKVNNTITEVTEVKDFSIPAQISAGTTPTPTP